MTLHEAIEKILEDATRPLSVKSIAEKINASDLYKRKDEKQVDNSQIQAKIRQYSNLFHNINNQIFLATDYHWKDILTTYWYLADTLRGLYSIWDLQYIIAVLFYFKRINDLKNRNNLYSDKAFRFSTEINKDKNVTSIKESIISDYNVIAEYTRINTKISIEKNIEIGVIIGKLKTEYYSDEEFGNIFEYLLHFNSLDSNKSPISYTPKNLRELMVYLLEPLPLKTIYDPVCGTGGILIEALHYSNGIQNIRGTEVNYRIGLLSFMNLEMHGFLDPEIIVKNCFEELASNDRYDYIIGDLPIDGIANIKDYYNLFNQWGIQVPSSNKGFNAIVLFILSKLNNNGRAVITVSESFLFKGGREKEVRELLISMDLIETIVGLPHGALRPNTEAKVSLVVLNKNKNNSLKNKIKFIQAVSTGGDKDSLDINNEEIIELNKQGVNYENKNIQIVEIKDLLKDTNLSAYAYDVEYFLAQKMFEEGSGKKLSDLVEIKSGIAIEKVDSSKDGDIPFVKIENLSKDILNLYLSANEISSKIYYKDKYEKNLISIECILVARIGDNLKPTYFKPSEKLRNILVHNGVCILIPRNNTIDLEYLYYQLNSSFVKEQINKFRLGSVMPYINIAGLKQILIPYVDIKSQKDFVLSQKANIIAAERAQVEEKIKALGYKEEKVQAESDIVRTLVHQLRPTLSNIDMEVKKIKRIIEDNALSDYRENNTNIDKNVDQEIAHLIVTPKNYTLVEIIEKLQNDTLQLNDVLTTVNQVMSFKLTPKDMEDVDLLTFIKEYLNIKKIEINNRFDIEVNGEHFIASINQASFKDLVDQLLINAERHAFSKQAPNINHKIQFLIKQNKERSIAIIEYQNNGKTFLLSPKDYITPFVKSQSSSGSGIGGNYIYRIIQAHSGEIVIKEGLKTGFALTIEFPLNQKNENE